MKTSSGFKFVVGLLIALLVLYVLMQIYLVTYPSYKTEIAVLYELSDEISAEGTVVRKETVSGDDSGIKYYLISDGDKVAKGEKVAEYYSDSDSAVRNLYIQRLKEELEILKGVSKGNRGDTNLSSIRRSVYNLMFDYSSYFARGDYSDISKLRNDLISYLSGYEVSAGGEVDPSVQIQKITEMIEALERLNSDPIGFVTAEESGFFVSFVDGCENIITADDFESMTPDKMKSMIKEVHDRYSYSDRYYKILSDYSWYYICTMPLEDAARLKTGNTYFTDFSFSAASDLPAVVHSILPSEDRSFAIVILAFDRMNPAAAVLRNEDINIKFSNYRGIKVKKTSLRLIDGELGVYIKYGNLVKFKKVDIIYETDDYILSSATEGSGSYLSLYDEIITSGKNLYRDRDLNRS